MIRRNENGSSTIWIIIVSLLSLLFIAAISFAFWAFSSRQNYKNNSDQIVAAAVKVAVDKNSTEKDNEFAQAEKSPLKTYRGPDTYGAIAVKYPKTWSAYVDTTGNDIPLDGFFYPNVVPGVDSGTSFALRLQVTSDSYDQELAQYSDNIQSGGYKISPYRAPKVSSKLGARIDGQIEQGKQGSMVLIPLRDKTLKIWTESTDYLSDFNNIILANLSFSP